VTPDTTHSDILGATTSHSDGSSGTTNVIALVVPQVTSHVDHHLLTAVHGLI